MHIDRFGKITARLSLFFIFFIKSLSCSEIHCEQKKTSFFHDAETLVSSFSTTGYYEFENREFNSSWYDELYLQFDAVLAHYDTDPNFREILDFADQEFGSRKEYGSSPMGMFIEKRSNKSKKSYFHFCDDYPKFINEFYPELFECEIFSRFILLLDQLRQFSDRAFENAVGVLDESGFGISAILKNDTNQFGTVVKVVRYEPGPINGSNPHVDFSGLSLLLDHSDSEEALVISPNTDMPKREDFLPPERAFLRGNTTSALLVPGLALKACGIPIEPTPHAVLKVDRRRYAVISFAMSPHITITYDQIKLKDMVGE